MAKPENPPAFPPSITATAAGDVYHGFDGMSLRDHFAGLALAGMGKWMPKAGRVNLNSECVLIDRAEWAYRQADAMLSARQTTDREDGK